jgi:hypothetical protein
MALTQLWKNTQDELKEKHVQQVISFAGKGKLSDGGPTSKEFRDFLALVPSVFLARYADECLKEKFDGSGFALQDVINEVGKRLGFQVEQGKYRGIQGQIGFDGLWRALDGNAIVVEVKTTDAYRIVLDTIAVYRRKLIADGKITEGKSSILIVVGRNDTGELEAQVRGSRHAWDVRLISIDALVRLMRLKEELEDPKIMEKIRRVLMPQEFTKIDGIIDLVFSAAEEVKKDEELPDVGDAAEDGGGAKKPKFVPTNFRDACAERVQKRLGKPLVKQSLAVYSSPDQKVTVVCINSREYQEGSYVKYWFAFHPHQQELLKTQKGGYVAFGCGSVDSLLLIPACDFLPWLDMCGKTELEDRFYWHIRITKDSDGFLFRVKKGFKAIELNKYLLEA